jgi:hypothetical protein
MILNLEFFKNKIGMPRIMFLDIDGVLCTMRSHFAFGDKKLLMESWDITVCQMIRTLCEDFNFKIVISSTWRMHNKSSSELRTHLATYGLIDYLFEGKGERKKWFYGSEDKSWEWRTKNLKYNGEEENGHRIRRGLEIDEWLKRHPFISDYIIIDDDSDMMEKQMSHFIKVKDSSEGFSSKNFEDIFNRYSDRYTK